MVSVSDQKLINAHITSSDSDDKFPVHDLTINLSCSKKIESTSESCARYLAIMLFDFHSHNLIDIISNNSYVFFFFLGGRWGCDWLRDVSPHLYHESESFDVLVSISDFISFVFIDLISDINLYFKLSNLVIHLY